MVEQNIPLYNAIPAMFDVLLLEMLCVNYYPIFQTHAFLIPQIVTMQISQSSKLLYIYTMILITNNYGQIYKLTARNKNITISLKQKAFLYIRLQHGRTVRALNSCVY